MRWADLDMLGHVNNVTYLNYLREARVDLFAALGRVIDVDDLAEGIRITRNQVAFLAPLLLRRAPVTIEVWVSDVAEDGFALNYEIFDEVDGGRRVYLRARAELEPWLVATDRSRALTERERSLLESYREDAIVFSPLADAPAFDSLPAAYDLTVRLSDLDIYRRVSDVLYFEYFQEARVAYLFELASRVDEARELVIARTDITYHQPVRLRREAYQVRSGIAALGTKSFTVASQIRDGDVPIASAEVVLVGFDSRRQSAAPLADAQRAGIAAELAAVRGA